MKRSKRRVLFLALLACVSATLEIAFASFGGGLITPEGSVSVRVALLGAGMLTMRLVAIFVLPLLGGFEVGLMAVDFWRARKEM